MVLRLGAYFGVAGENLRTHVTLYKRVRKQPYPIV
jgi:hypothetical protein